MFSIITKQILFLWNGGLDPTYGRLARLKERRLLSSFIFFVTPVCLILMLSNWLSGVGSDNGVLLGGLLLIWGGLFLQAFFQYQKLAANLAIFSYWTMPTVLMQSYGLQGTVMMWLLPVPAMAILLTGRKNGMVWGLICCVTLAVTGYLHANSLIDYNPVYHEFVPKVGITNAIEGILLIAILSGSAAIFRKAQRDSEGRLKSLVSRLKSEIANRRHAEKDAKRSEQGKSAFLSAMSHEIRTPLNGVIMAARLMVSAKTDAERAEYAGIVMGSSDILLELVSDVIDLNAMDIDNFKIANQTICTRELVIGTLRPFSFQAEEKGISLNVTIESNVPYYFLGDRTRAKQVIMNLVGNAIKFTVEGAVNVSLLYEDNKLLLVIDDTGVGISEESKEKLFEPFVQGSQSTRDEYGGSGLGLTIVKKIVTAMNGVILLKSEIGVGTKVSVYFPFIMPKLENIEKLHNNDLTIPEIEPLTLLIADDNAVNRMVLSRLLENDKHTVISVEDGQQALDYIKAHSVDAILMDIQMPVMNGEQSAAQIRSLPGPKSVIPIIAITANANSTDARRLLDSGFDGFLSKPFRREDLLRTLQESFAR